MVRGVKSRTRDHRFVSGLADALASILGEASTAAASPAKKGGGDGGATGPPAEERRLMSTFVNDVLQVVPAARPLSRGVPQHAWLRYAPHQRPATWRPRGNLAAAGAYHRRRGFCRRDARRRAIRDSCAARGRRGQGDAGSTAAAAADAPIS